MPWFDAMSGSRAIAAREDAWGHLRPEVGEYPGWIEVSKSDWGDYTMHACHFAGVDCNPFTHDAMETFAMQQDFEETGVYRWTGVYRTFEHVPEPDEDEEEHYDPKPVRFHRFEDGEWARVYPQEK